MADWEDLLWVAGPAALAGGVGVWVKGWFGSLLPAPSRAARLIRYRAAELIRWPVEAARPDTFLVVLCCIDGDDAQESLLRAIERTLSPDDHPALTVIRDWRLVSVKGLTRRLGSEVGSRKAERIGKEYRADIVIWGEVTKAAEGALLRLQGAGRTEPLEFALDKGFFRGDLRTQLGSVIAAVALSRIEGIPTDGQVQRTLDALRREIGALQSLVATPQEYLPPRSRGQVALALGHALSALGT